MDELGDFLDGKDVDLKIESFVLPEYSDWVCYLYGGGKRFSMVWKPEKGKEPNFFWRWMQFICFGNRWVKEKKLQ